MQHSILEGKEVAGHVFDVKDLAAYLNQLHDPRDNRGKIYSLGTILSMVVLARVGPTLLKELNLKNRVVCADAIQTQQTFCTTVLGGGGDYLLVAKGNQERLRADIHQYFQPARRAPYLLIPASHR